MLISELSNKIRECFELQGLKGGFAVQLQGKLFLCSMSYRKKLLDFRFSVKLIKNFEFLGKLVRLKKTDFDSHMMTRIDLGVGHLIRLLIHSYEEFTLKCEKT